MKVATDLPPDELAALDDWRRPRGLTRSEAMRRLILLALRRPGPRCIDPALAASLTWFLGKSGGRSPAGEGAPDEARRIAVDIALLPDLLGKAEREWEAAPAANCGPS
jgi:hypothetical protein